VVLVSRSPWRTAGLPAIEDVGGPRRKVRLALYCVADDAAAGAARDFVTRGAVEIGIAMAGWVCLEQHGYGAVHEVLGLYGVSERHRHRAGRRPGGQRHTSGKAMALPPQPL